MADYGIRLKRSATEVTTIIPSHSTIVAADTATMPNSLEGDNTYGIDIEISDSAVPEDEIAVLIEPARPLYSDNVVNKRFTYGGVLYASSQYANSAATFYTRNENTGVMSIWSAGNLTNADRNTWDPILAVFPVAFWDKTQSQDGFTSVRLFAATCYLVYDTSASAKLIVYSVGNKGVEKIDYLIAIKNYVG